MAPPRKVEEYDEVLLEESWQVFELILAQMKADGPDIPVHVDILDDDDGVTWPRVYAMHPDVHNGQFVGWWCPGCGYEKPVTP